MIPGKRWSQTHGRGHCWDTARNSTPGCYGSCCPLWRLPPEAHWLSKALMMALMVLVALVALVALVDEHYKPRTVLGLG